MTINSSLRKLAKSTYYQNIFYSSKELHNIQLFRNKCDFSQIQTMFLNYLYMYDSINKDILLGDVTSKVLNSEIYEDAYWLWKTSKDKKNTKDNKKKTKKGQSEVNLTLANKIKFPERS